MDYKDQESALKSKVSALSAKACPTCGTPCPDCLAAEKDDEDFEETDNRSTSELMEKGNKVKPFRREEV